MKPRLYVVLALLACSWLIGGIHSPLCAQLIGIVDDASDDEFAYPWDDPNTVADETVDGKIEDLSHRKTLRAALLEAAGMNNGDGVPANLRITATGTIVLTQGPLYPTDGSKIWSNSDITIDANVPHTAFGLGSRDTLDGLSFINGDFQVGIDSENVIVRCKFAYSQYDGLIVGGRWNNIGGERSTDANFFYAAGQNAIHIVGDSNWIMGNYVGTDMFGNSLGNKFGIFINGTGNTIGDVEEAYANIVAANDKGIAIAGDTIIGGKENLIIGNYIGVVPLTPPGGDILKGNKIGIELISAKNNQIGDFETVPGEHPGNKIYGNTEQGILVGYDAIGTWIFGNEIILNREGINLGPGSRKAEVRDNSIHGNEGEGIVITGFKTIGNDAPSRNHMIAHNKIRRNASVSHSAGIAIVGEAYDNVIGDQFQDVYPPDQRNIIMLNRGNGVLIAEKFGNQPIRNTIRENWFIDNNRKGILISNAQNGIQPPTITSASTTPLMGHVTGEAGWAGWRIDIYQANLSDSGHYEGNRYLGTGFVQNDLRYSIEYPALGSALRVIATVTDPDGNTSEFSTSKRVSGARLRRFRQGANAVSSSVVPSNSSAGSVFSGSSGNTYGWSGPVNLPGNKPSTALGSYAPQDTILNGAGYWVKYESEVEDSLTGLLQGEDTIAVTSGWNFIGSISAPVPVSQIVSIPDGLVTSQFFGYDSAYFVADTIQPGYAYWVKMSTPGSLILAMYDSLSAPEDSLLPLPESYISIVPDGELPPAPPPEVLSGTATTQLSLNTGWNMSSVPVVVPDFQTTSLFPGATTNVFAYLSGSYAAQGTLANRLGYWVKYGNASMVSMTGTPIALDTFDVALGWNLIGSISNPVLVSSIVSVPGGMVTSPFFKYDLSYTSADTIQPGRAYWVKTAGAGTLVLSSSGNTPSANRIKIVPDNEHPPSPPDGSISGASGLIPSAFELAQNHPNPFNPATVIQYAVPSLPDGQAGSQYISLKVYNVLGQQVAELVNGMQSPGYKSVEWDASKMTSGVYFYRLHAGTFTSIKKMLLAK